MNNVNELKDNLMLLIADFIDEVKIIEPKRYNGSANYFAGIISRVIDESYYDLGDRVHLKKLIKSNLLNTYDNEGKKKTNWGYKKDVIPLIERVYRNVNH